MIRNYLLIARRNFRRSRLFSLLNMFGLALGLAGAVFIFLYVTDEWRYDTMHPHYDQTYRIGNTFNNPDGRSFDNTESPGYWLKHLKETRSEVVDGIRIAYIGYPTSLHHKATDKIVLTEEIRWAEPGFDRVLWFRLLRGNRENMFADYNSMVISETGARRLFGAADPIGQTITVKHRFATHDRELDVVVTGVYKDYPSNSHFKPVYMVNVNALRQIHPQWSHFMEGTRFGDRENDLGFFELYAVLRPGADPSALAASLQPVADQMVHTEPEMVAEGWKIVPSFTKMTDLHFDEKNQWEGNTKGNKQYLAIFSAIAVLILVIACINYMNLATARSTKRAKEVGLRKSLGGGRREIAAQFFLESFLSSAVALVPAMILILALLEPFNALADKTFTRADIFSPPMLGIIGMAFLFTGLLSGIYPALYLSGFQPVEVLKGRPIKGSAAEWFKKGLVAAQYAVSLTLVICTLTAIRQMNHMQETRLNAQGDQLLSIRYGGIAHPDKFPVFKEAVRRDPELQFVTLANHLPRLNYFGFIGYRVKFPELDTLQRDWNVLNVEYDFIKTFGLEIHAGRDFDGSDPNDSTACLVNEAAVKALNLPPDKVLGLFVADAFDRQAPPLKIVGVVKDFPFRSMHHTVEPLVLSTRPHFIDRIAYVKLPAGKFQEKIAGIERAWREVFPNTGMDYWFVEDEFNRMYITEKRVAALAKIFAVLAILITVLGVFGLASWMAEQKTKEVGIRKSLGAATSQVTGMFTLVFVRILGVSACFALPAAYILIHFWLRDFAYPTTISPVIFIGSLLGLFVITALTVGWEISKAARANPVVSLRIE